MPPLNIGNRSPFVAVFISPQLIAIPPQAGAHQWSIVLDGASHSLIETQASQNLALDGETWRAELAWSFRPAARWVLHASIPWLSHSGGQLDPLIDQWHKLTGLPDGERPGQPRNRLEFMLQTPNESLRLGSAANGPGDLTLGTMYRWSTTASSQTWIHADVKLPTGSISKLTGSEGTDIALSLEHRRILMLGRHRTELAMLTGFIRTGSMGKLARLQKPQQTFATVHWGAKPASGLAPELQLRWRSATYTSATDHLGEAALAIDGGLRWRTRHGVFQAGISEDIKVDSAPDVGFYLRFTRPHFAQ